MTREERLVWGWVLVFSLLGGCRAARTPEPPEDFYDQFYQDSRELAGAPEPDTERLRDELHRVLRQPAGVLEPWPQQDPIISGELACSPESRTCIPVFIYP